MEAAIGLYNQCCVNILNGNESSATEVWMLQFDRLARLTCYCLTINLLVSPQRERLGAGGGEGEGEGREHRAVAERENEDRQ